MEIPAFTKTLSAEAPPASFSIAMKTLWYDAKGDWHKAHDLINDLEDGISAHIHAYLHRKEGDAGNARYWYGRAGKKPSSLSLEEEWKELVLLYAN